MLSRAGSFLLNEFRAAAHLSFEVVFGLFNAPIAGGVIAIDSNSHRACTARLSHTHHDALEIE